MSENDESEQLYGKFYQIASEVIDKKKDMSVLWESFSSDDLVNILSNNSAVIVLLLSRMETMQSHLSNFLLYSQLIVRKTIGGGKLQEIFEKFEQNNMDVLTQLRDELEYAKSIYNVEGDYEELFNHTLDQMNEVLS